MSKSNERTREVNLPRIGYDGDESIYFDRTKPITVEGAQFFEECDPEAVCAEIEEERDRLANLVAPLVTRVDNLKRQLADHCCGSGISGCQNALRICSTCRIAELERRNEDEKFLLMLFRRHWPHVVEEALSERAAMKRKEPNGA